MFGFANLKDLLGYGTEQYLAVKANEAQYDIAAQELAYKKAQEKRAAAEAAAIRSKNLVTSDTVSKVVFWTLTTIAGSVLGAIVLKAVK